MKKILYIFLFLLVSITASAYDAKIDGIYYDLVPKAKVAIVTEGDTKYEGDHWPTSFLLLRKPPQAGVT